MPVVSTAVRLSKTRKRLAKKIKALILAAQASDLKTGITYLVYQPILVVEGDQVLSDAVQTVMNQLNAVIDIGTEPGEGA